MIETLNKRRITEANLDISRSGYYLPKGFKLMQRDILLVESPVIVRLRIPKVVAILAPFSNERLPAYAVLIGRSDSSQITASNYFLSDEGDREFLGIVSSDRVISSRPVYEIYNQILREAGQ